MSDDTDNKSPVKRSSVVIAAVVAIPLLYLLSIGPAVAISEKFPSSGPTMRRVYLPIIWLHHHTVLRGPIEAYLELWVGEP